MAVLIWRTETDNNLYKEFINLLLLLGPDKIVDK